MATKNGMVSISGLSEEQNEALQDIQGGDLIFIQKIVPAPQVDEDSEDEADDVDQEQESDEESDGEDDENDEEHSEDDEEDPEDEATSQADEDDEEEADDEDAFDGSNSTDATEIYVPPRMYAVSAIAQDAAGNVTDITVSRLTYSSKVDQETHSYHIYGKECVHHHDHASCEEDGAVCTTASKIAAIIQDETFRLTIKPDGDLVKGVDDSVRAANNGRRCITGCDQGYLAKHEDLQDLIKDYDPPTLGHPPDARSGIMPSVCPICYGVDVLKTQQALQGQMLLGGGADLGAVADFIASLTPRRQQLGYRFRQFDERQWGYMFDDMMSDEEDDNGGYDGQFEHWPDAMDPNSNPAFTPSNSSTIDTLPRKLIKDTALSTQDSCNICLADFKEDAVVLELPCGHVNYHEECIVAWLKESGTCPNCRKVPPKTAEPAQDEESEEEDVYDEDKDQVTGEENNEPIQTEEMDGEDSVMSDA